MYKYILLYRFIIIIKGQYENNKVLKVVRTNRRLQRIGSFPVVVRGSTGVVSTRNNGEEVVHNISKCLRVDGIWDLVRVTVEGSGPGVHKN